MHFLLSLQVNCPGRHVVSGQSVGSSLPSRQSGEKSHFHFIGMHFNLNMTNCMKYKEKLQPIKQLIITLHGFVGVIFIICHNILSNILYPLRVTWPWCFWAIVKYRRLNVFTVFLYQICQESLICLFFLVLDLSQSNVKVQTQICLHGYIH